MLALGAGLLAGPQPDDDAFITLRYARSLAEGNGFVFNPGEHVLATTTPLFTMLVATARRVTSFDLVWLAYTLALAAHAAAVMMIIRVGCACHAKDAGWLAGCLYALAPVALRGTVACMETSLFVFATLCALAPTESPHLLSQSIAAAVAVLLRPEGIVTVGLVLIDSAAQGMRAALRSAGVIGALILPWALFAQWYFGTPVPHSLLVKWGAHSVLPSLHAVEAFWYLLLTLPSAAPMIDFGGAARPFGAAIAQTLALPFSAEGGRIAVLILGAGIMLICATGALILYRRNVRILPLLLFAGVYISSYCLAHPYMHSWYVVPPLPVLLLSFVVGGAAAIGLLWRGQRSSRARATTAGALLGVALWQSARLIWSFPASREAGYRQAVAMLGPVSQSPTLTIGALEVGTIGYYSRARIVDHFGLLTPTVGELGAAGTIEHYHPDFYIGQDVFFAFAGLFNTQAFLENYDLVARLPSQDSREPSTLIYAKRSAPR